MLTQFLRNMGKVFKPTHKDNDNDCESNIDNDNNDIQNDTTTTTNSIGLHPTILICGQTDLFCAQ